MALKSGLFGLVFLVVVVFISSLFTGMGVLVARYAGANEPDKVNRVVYQAFLTSVALALGVLAPLGYVGIELLLEVRDEEHSRDVIKHLTGKGYHVDREGVGDWKE